MNSKEDLLTLLEKEQIRLNKRIRRHEDVMTDSQVQELVGQRAGLAYAIAQIEKFGSAAA